MKAFSYIRVSSNGQVNRGGFDRQERAISKYARENGIEVVSTFREEGVSGTLEDRPALARMLVSLEQNGHGISTVIIEKLDRLARDLMVQEAIIRDFKLKGFALISAAEGPDLLADDPSRKLIRQVFGSIAEYEKSMLVQKLKASRERIRATSGKCEGRKGYHDTEEGKSIVRRIHALRRKYPHRKRRTWQQIADILNSEGVSTMEGRTWTLHRVQQTAKIS
jgi:DNA invertase Pin-like site-specific DNA recombinase